MDRRYRTVRGRVLSANAYLGAATIVEALGRGAEIVITGRVTDTGLTLGPMIHEFGWAADDWDRLAAGTVAGHIIECGGCLAELPPGLENHLGWATPTRSWADGTSAVTNAPARRTHFHPPSPSSCHRWGPQHPHADGGRFTTSGFGGGPSCACGACAGGPRRRS
jgi:hypothetical protein